MFRVTVEESFAAGHALRGYRGKCENVHGHNYKVRVTLEGPELNSIGLLADFKEVKDAMHSAIGRLDHQFLNDLPAFREINPSAENIAKYFYEEISKLLAGDSASGAGNGNPPSAACRLGQVTVWETDTTAAVYSAE